MTIREVGSFPFTPQQFTALRTDLEPFRHEALRPIADTARMSQARLMNSVRKVTASLIAMTSMASCQAAQPPAEELCSPIGQRLERQTIHGIIYSDISMRARIDACPGKELPLAFVGDDPPPIAQLHARAG